jgi:AAA+ superfamily predicted ATPase
MQDFAETLHTYLSASYPFLWLVTHEETRALGLLTQLAQGMGRAISVWRPEDTPDPEAALDAELERLLVAPAGEVHVLLDADPWLDTPVRTRTLRRLQQKLYHRVGHVVFISPRPFRPSSLVRDWTVLDVPLPGLDELMATLHHAAPPDRWPALDRHRMATAALGLTGRQARRAFERALHLHQLAVIRRQAFDWEVTVLDEKRRLLREGGALEFCETGLSLDAVGGLEELKRWLGERAQAFGEEARRFGLPQPRGLLLVGVQGCGKSLMARAVASHWGLPLLRLDPGTLFSGSTSPDEALRQALATAERLAPSVLWVDEVEKGFDPETGGETTRLLGSLLTWLQEKQAPVFFIATANQVQHLPPELLRRGRVDEIFFVDLPDATARRQILQIHLSRRGRELTELVLDEVVDATENFSGAELEQVVIAALYATFAERRALRTSDLVTAARTLIPLYVLYEIEVKALRTWAHDRARSAGHDRRLVDLFGTVGAPPPGRGAP